MKICKGPVMASHRKNFQYVERRAKNTANKAKIMKAVNMARKSLALVKGIPFGHQNKSQIS